MLRAVGSWATFDSLKAEHQRSLIAHLVLRIDGPGCARGGRREPALRRGGEGGLEPIPGRSDGLAGGAFEGVGEVEASLELAED